MDVFSVGHDVDLHHPCSDDKHCALHAHVAVMHVQLHADILARSCARVAAHACNRQTESCRLTMSKNEVKYEVALSVHSGQQAAVSMCHKVLSAYCAELLKSSPRCFICICLLVLG